MPITRSEFLNTIIEDGIKEVMATYTRPDQKEKMDGSIAGFEACRDRSDEELLMLKGKAEETCRRAMLEKANDYWWHRCFELQVEWTLNVLSAAMYVHDMDVLVPVTARGMAKAMNILKEDRVRF